MRPNDDIDFTTLTWVKGELDETLKQAQLALEAYVEDPNDASQMRFCATYLHQVQGTLRMVELYGAAMVTEEMEQLASALLDSPIGDRDEAYAVLMRGIVQLPDYLERLQSGHKDIPIVLLPLLNDLRAARGEKGLSEIVLFTPDLGRALPASAAGPATALPEQELRRYATTLRGHFQIALLKWFKNEAPDQNISTLAQVCDKLVSITAQEEARRLFWVAASVLDALRAKAFEPSPQLKQTIGKVEREIKRLADAGENSFRVDPPRELTRNLLYFVAHAPTDHGRIGELRQVFNLDSLLPSEAELDHARGSMSGHNRALLDTVSVAIKDDLMRVKDALDLYLRTQNAQPADLSSQVDVLDRVSDTLGMLGLGVARRVVVEQRDAVHQVASGHRPANESSLLDIAGALLYVEATLDDQVQHLGQAGGGLGGNDGGGTMQAAESRRVLEAVVKEAQNNFAAAKAAFVAFIESNWDHTQLEAVPSLMGEVAGAMRIVELPRPAQYLDAVKIFTQVELLSRRRVPAGTQMETLADVLASLEYFLEALGEHRAGRDKILDVAERSLEALGYWPVPAASVMPTDAELAAVDARVADAIAASDDPYAEQVPLLIAETPLPPPSLRAPTPVTPAASEPVPAGPPTIELPAVTAPLHAEPVPVAATPSVPLAGFEGASDEIDDEIREVFVEEVQEEIANLEDLLPTWKADPANMDHLKSIRRVFHTLKGSGRLVGALTLGEFSWKIENMLNRVLDHSIQPTPAVIDVVDHAFNALPELLAALRGQGAANVDLEGIKAIAERVGAGEQVRYEPRALPPLASLGSTAAPPVLAQTEQPAVLDVAQADAATIDESVSAAAAFDVDARDFDIEAPADEAPTAVESFDLDALDAEPADLVAFEDATDELVARADAPLADATTADTAPAEEFAAAFEDAPVYAAPAPATVSVAVPSIDPVLFDILKTEVAGHLDTVDAYLDASAAAPQPITDNLLRAVHTMNGAFAMTDVPVITDVLGPLEGYLKRLLAHGITPSAGGRVVLIDTAAAVRALMLELERPQPRLADLGDLVERIATERDALPEAGGPSAAPLMPTDADDGFDAVAAERGPGLTEAVSMSALQDGGSNEDRFDVDALEARLDGLLGAQDSTSATPAVDEIDLEAAFGIDRAFDTFDATPAPAARDESTLPDARHPEFDLADELADELGDDITLTDTSLTGDTLRIEDDFLPVSDLALDDDALAPRAAAAPEYAIDALDDLALSDTVLPASGAFAESTSLDDATFDTASLDAADALDDVADRTPADAATATGFDAFASDAPSADIVVTDEDRLAWAAAADAERAAEATPEFATDSASDETPRTDGTVDTDAPLASSGVVADEVPQESLPSAAADTTEPPFEFDAEEQAEFEAELFDLEDAADAESTFEMVERDLDGSAIAEAPRTDHAATASDDADLRALIDADAVAGLPAGDTHADDLADDFAAAGDARSFDQVDDAAITPPSFAGIDAVDLGATPTPDGSADALELADLDAIAADATPPTESRTAIPADEFFDLDASLTGVDLGDLETELADAVANVPGSTARTPDGLLAVDAAAEESDEAGAESILDDADNAQSAVAGDDDLDAYWRDAELEAAGLDVASADAAARDTVGEDAASPAFAALDTDFAPSATDTTAPLSLDDYDWDALERETRPDAVEDATASDAAAVTAESIDTVQPDQAAAPVDHSIYVFDSRTDTTDAAAPSSDTTDDTLAAEAAELEARFAAEAAELETQLAAETAELETAELEAAELEAAEADAGFDIDNGVAIAADESEDAEATDVSVTARFADTPIDDLIFIDDEEDETPAAVVPVAPAPPRPDPRDLAIAAAFLAGLDDADPDPDAPLELADMDEELLDIFLEEGGDLLDHSDGLMTRLRETPEDRESVVGMQRDLHTLKGGARMAGIAPVGDLSHAMESLLEAVAEGRRELPVYGVDLLQRAFDRLHGMVTRVGERRALAMPTLLIERVEALVQGDIPTLPQAFVDSTATETVDAPAAERRSDAVAAPATPATPKLAPLSAPIEDSLGDDDDIAARLPQEQIRIRADLLDRLVNYAGEVAIYRARLEQQLGLFRGNLSELEQTTLRLREQLRKLEIETEAQIASRYQREAEIGGEAAFDPLELDRFSTLQQLTRALSESAADIVNLQGTLDDHTRQYETLLLQQSRVSSDLQEGLMRTRMVPFDSLVPRLRRIIRQTGTELGKKAQLKVDGAQGEMDRNVLERMTAPLEHMLRNALAHGLEIPADRIAAGKPDEGLVRINVLREGSEVVIKVTDDGRGLDRDAIRNKAIARGLLIADAPVSDRDLYAFILEPGFSTAETVSKIAGRGVGMDVVHSEIRQLGGTLQIDSERGKGTVFTIRLPFTLAVTQAVFVKQGETSFAVPIASVQGVARIDRDELEAKLAAGDAKFVYAGEEFLIHDMGLLLGDAPVKAEGSLQVPLLLARSGDQRAAICVDQVIGSREIVVKPVGPQVGSIPGIFGATIMGDGRVIVILDVAPLVRRHVALRKPDEPRAVHVPVEARRIPLVMVVDDSITMRKVTSRVLERHSYEVLTAKDGVDAIEKLADRVPDVMLLDIEMPRMDGYELATHMRNDVRLRGVPIIMITSRTGEKHRQRAFEIGVDRYLGKPYQEAELMRNVQEILKVGRGELA